MLITSLEQDTKGRCEHLPREKRQLKCSAVGEAKQLLDELFTFSIFPHRFLQMQCCLNPKRSVKSFCFPQINTTEIQDIDLSRFVPQEVDNTGITVASVDRFSSRNKTKPTEEDGGKNDPQLPHAFPLKATWQKQAIWFVVFRGAAERSLRRR